jgi:ABC-type enterochelin transport system substrate-binding protein
MQSSFVVAIAISTMLVLGACEKVEDPAAPAMEQAQEAADAAQQTANQAKETTQ